HSGLGCARLAAAFGSTAESGSETSAPKPAVNRPSLASCNCCSGAGRRLLALRLKRSLRKSSRQLRLRHQSQPVLVVLLPIIPGSVPSSPDPKRWFLQKNEPHPHNSEVRL